MKNTILFFLFVVLVSSCNHESLTSIGASYVVQVREKKIDQLQKLSQLIDSVVYIPLETAENCLIGRISKIVYGERCFYILDDTANCLFKFDESGGYLTKYDRVGKGPLEYLKISDFNLDRTGACYVLDSRQIIKLDKDLKPLATINLPMGAQRFCVKEDGFAIQTYSAEDELLVLSSSGAKEYSLFVDNGSPRYVPLKPFEATPQRVLFNPCHSNVMYDVTQEKAVAYLVVDFEYPVPDDYFKAETGNRARVLDSTIPDTYMNGIDYYSESNDDVFFSFNYNHKGYDGPFYVKFSKRNNETIIFTNRIENDCYQSMYPPNIIAATDAGWFISVIQSSVFNESLKNCRGLFLNGTNRGQVSDVDNPIIALVRFKDNTNEN